MKIWLIYGLIVAVFWGIYIVFSKIATSEKHLGVNPSYVSLFMLIGIATVFIGRIVYEGKVVIPQSKIGILFGILSGIFWALGMILSLEALKAGADVSKLVPIYNINTLIAVLLGIILLHEIPSGEEIIKVIVGTMLITVGAILISS